MPLSVRYKPCLGAFFWILMFVVLPQQACAGTPDCGMVNRGLVKSVYEAGRKVEHLVEVRAAMSTFCASVEGLEQWERGASRSQRNRDYKGARRALIKNAERDLRVLKGRLVKLRGWTLHKPRTKKDKVVRLDRISEARNEVLSSVMRMGGYSGQTFLLRSGVY